MAPVKPTSLEGDAMRPESSILPRPSTSPSAATNDDDDDEEADYFTATAVPIRASTMSAIPISPTFLPDNYYTSSAHNSVISTSQFPQPPGRGRASHVFQHDASNLPPSAKLLKLQQDRLSVLSATPSLFPQPPSWTTTAAAAAAGATAGGLASQRGQRPSVVSRFTLSVAPPPPPPPKEEDGDRQHRLHDLPTPRSPASSGGRSLASPTTTIASTTLLGSPVTWPQQHHQHYPPSPISPHSPLSNPSLTPLTVQTLAHLSATALRSPSLTFVDPLASPPPLTPSSSHAGSGASGLTSAQRDRLWELKRVHDVRHGLAAKRKAGRGKGKGKGRGRKGGVRTYVWVGMGVSVLALGVVVGLVVGLNVIMGGA